jgi:DNA-binding NarL/FixJ family response regulator
MRLLAAGSIGSRISPRHSAIHVALTSERTPKAVRSIHVLVIDAHISFLQKISRLIESEPDLVVIGEGSSVADGHTLLRTTRADVLVVDASLPDGSGLALARATRERSATMGIVVLTMHQTDDTLLGALDAGASALVLKSASSDEVINAVRQAATAPDAFSANGLAAAMHHQQAAVAARTHLTPREGEVLQHLVAGESVAQVAHHLLMSESTVKTHIGKVYEKLGTNKHGANKRAANKRAATNMEAVRLHLVNRGRPRNTRA